MQYKSSFHMFYIVFAIALFVGSATTAVSVLANSISEEGTADTTSNECGKLRSEIPQPDENFPTTRDPWLHPFDRCSIWNMPVGDKAQYVPANLGRAGFFGADREYFYKLKQNDPMRRVLSPGSFGPGRCTGTQSMQLSLPVPDDLIVPDATSQPYSTPNNAAAFLMPDGKTIEQLEPLARCTAGGNVHGWRNPWSGVDIYGDGIRGTHFGSGLSAIGGSIRFGELTGDKPIRHALKLLVWGERYLHVSKNTPGYRWPADRADQYAAKTYKGSNAKLVQGSLLAIPPKVKKENLALQTPAAKKIFQALQDYGGYIVDDAYWDAHYLAVERGVPEEVRNRHGYEIEGSSGPFYDDMMKVFSVLHIIDNNGLNNIGGGGKLRMPLAPPFK